MPSAHYVHPEFGYLAPTSRWRRDLKVAAISIFFGAIAGAGGLTVLIADHNAKTDVPSTSTRVEVSTAQPRSDPGPGAQSDPETKPHRAPQDRPIGRAPPGLDRAVAVSRLCRRGAQPHGRHPDRLQAVGAAHREGHRRGAARRVRLHHPGPPWRRHRGGPTDLPRQISVPTIPALARARRHLDKSGARTVPTISFRLLYGLLILQHGRRELLWVGVTAHPTAEWIARQLTEAHTGGSERRAISFAAVIASMAMPSSVGCGRWEFGIGRLQCGHHGRTDVLNGSSDPPGGIALTMSLCLASGTFVICSTHIKNTTTRPAPLCPWRRTRRFRARSRPAVKPWPCRSWIGSTTNMFEPEFPTRTGDWRQPRRDSRKPLDSLSWLAHHAVG